MNLKRIEEKIGFDQIRAMLRDHCRGGLGVLQVDQMEFSRNSSDLTKKLSELKEMLILVDAMEAPTQPEYEDPHQIFKKLHIQDSYLIEEELFRLKSYLSMFNDWKNCLKEHEGDLKNLENQTLKIDFPSYLEYRLDETIDEHGLMRSTASDTLSRIRKKSTRLKEKIRETVSRALADSKKKGFANTESEWSMRNGRFVIPLNVAFKRSISGFIMDYSGSGQTAFVEPRETFSMNNDLIDLQQEEKEEIIRILKELTDECRKHEAGLLDLCDLVGKFDFLRAKAFLAQDLEGTVAKLSTGPKIFLISARHPLLFVAHQKENRPVVPMDLSLDSNTRLIIISGPNAGGKSVALKTVGLLQFMFQNGLPISADGSSEFGLFENIFVDIGDDQSIENDLSTFSSHMVNMTQALKSAGPKTLLLFDEFGAGTDPLIGGAIGEALLSEFNKKKCFGVMNTHYPNLKKVADREDGIENAAMLFDSGKMKPTFEFSPGQAGSSFAFEIAKRSGLPGKVLDQAKKISGEDFMAFDQLLLETQEKNQELNKKIKELGEQKEKSSRVQKELDERLKELKKEKTSILNMAKEEAQELFKDSSRRIEETIRKIKESQAGNKETKELRKELKDFQISIKPGKDKEPVFKSTAPDIKLKKGIWVELSGSSSVGKIVELKSDEALVEIGNLKVRVKVKELIPTNNIPTGENLSGSSAKQNLKEVSDFDPILDLRGQRVGEATENVYKFLDAAVVQRVERLKIIHGRGDGHLRKLVVEMLDKNSSVRKHYFESEQFGGDGVTIVEL
jgi:DNA mismatch repair protein MutS2